MSINDFRLYGSRKTEAHEAASPKASGSVDVSAPELQDVEPEPVQDVVAEAPTSANKKAEIKGFLVSQGHDEADLDGLTKAELLALV